MLNILSGLASNNVQDLTIANKHVWLASGKELQKIPLTSTFQHPQAKVYLKNSDQVSNKYLQLEHDKTLVLIPEASIYASNGNFEYAYRINKNEWIVLPATIEQIEIQNLPIGNLTIELKVIDHLGRNSENTIVLKGSVAPPFYKTWWFFACLFVFLLLIIYKTYQFQLAKQKKKFKHQNELNIAKLTALRSQMNPHFIFNSLNSIQDLILQEKTVKSKHFFQQKKYSTCQFNKS